MDEAKNAFKGIVLLLPKHVLKEINQLIEERHKAQFIRSLLKKRYTGKIDIPSLHSLRVYIDWYINKNVVPKDKLIKNLLNNVSEDNKMEQSSVNVKDKQQLLENLIRKCDHRIESLESYLKTNPLDLALDKVLVRYISEIREVVETLAKLSGEIKEEQTFIVNVVNNELDSVFQIFYNVLKKVCPDKVDEIKKNIEDQLSLKGE